MSTEQKKLASLKKEARRSQRQHFEISFSQHLKNK